MLVIERTGVAASGTENSDAANVIVGVAWVGRVGALAIDPDISVLADTSSLAIDLQALLVGPGANCVVAAHAGVCTEIALRTDLGLRALLSPRQGQASQSSSLRLAYSVRDSVPLVPDSAPVKTCVPSSEVTEMTCPASMTNSIELSNARNTRPLLTAKDRRTPSLS